MPVERFEVQARLIERRGNVVVRNETRLGSTTTLGEAERHARSHVAAGFTVWIFRVTNGAPCPEYSMIEFIEPRGR